MNILGISAYYHDSAAALIHDGEIVGAAQEERFSRKKHDARFPEGPVDLLADFADDPQPFIDLRCIGAKVEVERTGCSLN